MDIEIIPARLSGEVAAPPSKSMAHRLILCAALSDGESEVRNVAFSDDIVATVDAATALGAVFTAEGDTLRGGGPLHLGGVTSIDSNESGSTLRFFLPAAAVHGIRTTFYGNGQLPHRPIGPLSDEMERHGALFSRKDGMPFTVSGRLTPGVYTLPGDISSQYITGLLYALPLLKAPSEIVLSSPLESAGYVRMTLRALALSGILVDKTTEGWYIPAPQEYQPIRETVEGDWSNAAAWLCLNALGADIRCTGLDESSAQGDRAVRGILAQYASGEQTIHIDASEVPDLIPVLCAVAAASHATTWIDNAARLRLKECDRLRAIAECVNGLGGQANEHANALIITGAGRLRGGVVDGHGDHRIVMAAAVCAAACAQTVTIRGAQAVRKSYPDFFAQYAALGGRTNGIDMGE